MTLAAFLVPLIVALLSSILLVLLLRPVSHRTGMVALPRQDRWHRQPTPLLGGMGMFLAYVAGMATAPLGDFRWELLLGPGFIFLLGLYDDLRQLSPTAKLIGQILGAAILVLFGYSIDFFPWDLANVVLTFVWLVGITNAINLLDNMDGLAGGVVLIAAGFLSYFFWSRGDFVMLGPALALLGAVLGFVLFNFPPASIFMGDSGSLFLGFTLASLAIARLPRASNVFAVMGVPTLLLLLPILDTLLVTVTRLLRGRSPVRGGRDHTSHRLVAFGLSERQAVLVLYAIALVSGIAGTVLESLDYDLSLVLIPILLVSLALLVAYLGRFMFLPAESPDPGGLTRLMVELTFKRRILEVILDSLLIGIAYYLALWTRSGFSLGPDALERFVLTLPLVVALVLVVAIVSGVYRGVWRYVGVDDLIRYGRAAIGGPILAAGALAVAFPDGLNIVVHFLFAVFLFLGLTASRLSFVFLDRIYSRQAVRGTEVSVLICGAGDAGEIALRWILRNPELGYQPVGFLDEDPLKWGRRIHGIDVLGGIEQLESVLARQKVDGLILTPEADPNGQLLTRWRSISQEKKIWIRRLRLEFELLD